MAELQVKIILVGSSGVGKTSLVSAYFDNPFENELTTTVAPASCNATVTLPNNVNVNMSIWDTAGQEKFQSISIMFYRDANVAFVCWDWKQDGQLDQWISQVRGESPDCHIFLVVTKSDLLSDDDIKNIQNSTQQLLEKYDAKHLFITSSLKNTNVKELFDKAATYYQKDETELLMDLALTNNQPVEKSGCC